MNAFDAQHFVFVPIDELTKPIPGTPRVVVDSYWLVDADDRVAFYNPVNSSGDRQEPQRLGSAQTNTDERVGQKVGPSYPWCVGARKLPLVFIPQSPARVAALIAASTPTTTAAPTAETGA